MPIGVLSSYDILVFAQVLLEVYFYAGKNCIKYNC